MREINEVACTSLHQYFYGACAVVVSTLLCVVLEVCMRGLLNACKGAATSTYMMATHGVKRLMPPMLWLLPRGFGSMYCFYKQGTTGCGAPRSSTCPLGRRGCCCWRSRARKPAAPVHTGTMNGKLTEGGDAVATTRASYWVSCCTPTH